MSIQQSFPAVNHHPKLRAPITNVIVANDFVSEKLGDARERVPEHGAADVANVHRFRHVWRSKINYDPACRSRPCHTEAFVFGKLARFFCDRVRTQCEIDEARTGNSWSFAPLADVEMRENVLRNFIRIFAPLLPEHESSIRLIIAETWIGRRRHLPSVRQVCLHERLRKLFPKK